MDTDGRVAYRVVLHTLSQHVAAFSKRAVLSAVNRVVFIEVTENCSQTKQLNNFLSTL